MSEQDLATALKQGMRNLASGVCVITALNEDGSRVAMTASSVTSVSDDPPSLLVCVNRSAALGNALQVTSGFSVNVLHSEHEEVSNTCARPSVGDGRFQVGDWQIDESTGLSFLNDALASFICEKQKNISYGTHNIYIGNIHRVHFGDGEPDILVYAKGGYHRI